MSKEQFHKMKNKRIDSKKIITIVALWAAFLLFTVFAATVDVKPIGPENSKVGFASINGAFHELTGFNIFWYKLTKALGILEILTSVFFVCYGLMQVIKRKGISGMDKDLIALYVFYAAVVFFYILFDKVIINYRPVIMDEGLEASYPSTHTLIAVCVLSTAIIQTGRRITDTVMKRLLTILCAVIMVITVIGRLISGVHWFTDILGGVLLSVALVYTYRVYITGITSIDSDNSGISLQ